ncbi:nucleotidyltransferase domain-containing protein [Synechococcus sp. CS-602]|uniref:nucleotidyltransferase domain-containing protein n=1 Tax=Synechococcaceae TaxID=1890426 RepID=UPI00223B0B22|nr:MULTISPECIES: nucleotidyltransferase domain-containing protein [Synechococcaceae]MCT0205767.1 nucleotidyltransferase domain-containing protein [Synechococcus sp. CS-602]MCT4368575.1 nucleotidyltransferase domain-containing protein [Candidatus Regnicoccus frigidus MAG-AL2]
MTATPLATPVDPRINQIAAQIRAEIPEAQVRLFGSRARGTARVDSDVDLLITVPDGWLDSHPRWQLLAAINRRLERHLLPIDLLLYAESEVRAKRNWRHHVIARAYQEGRLLDDG